MAKNEKTRKSRVRKGPSRRPHSTPSKAVEPSVGAEEVHMDAAVRSTNDAASVKQPPPEEPEKANFTVLDLTDCPAEITYLAPRVVRYALIEAEGVEPRVVERILEHSPLITPALVIRGSRARLIHVLPTLRQIRRVAMYSGDTHDCLMGMINGLPHARLAEFENGPTAWEASEELVRHFELWEGRMFILLETRGPNYSDYRVGHYLAAHVVDLERPVLWHRGER